MRSVEAVQKVLKQIFGRDAEKNDLTEYVTINDLMVRKGQVTPENHPMRPLSDFFYRLVGSDSCGRSSCVCAGGGVCDGRRKI